MAKPDNRVDNPAKLQQHIDNTAANIVEAEHYLAEHGDEISPDEEHAIAAKNDRRKASMRAFDAEKDDELADRAKHREGT